MKLSLKSILITVLVLSSTTVLLGSQDVVDISTGAVRIDQIWNHSESDVSIGSGETPKLSYTLEAGQDLRLPLFYISWNKDKPTWIRSEAGTYRLFQDGKIMILISQRGKRQEIPIRGTIVNLEVQNDKILLK